MPHLQRLYEENKDKGLHIFHIEAQGHSREQVEKFIRSKNATFPQVPGSGGFENYPCGSGLPYGYLIGVDGTIVWQDHHGYEAKLQEELKKVKFPGLGKQSLAKGLDKCAALLSQKQYGKAIEESQKKLDAERAKADGADAAVIADAEYIIQRANTIGDRLVARATKQKEEREYQLAMASYKSISDQFKGVPRGDEAKTKLEELKDDANVKKELKAEAALEQLLKTLEKVKDADQRKQALNAFAEKNKGMKAAERAAKLALE